MLHYTHGLFLSTVFNVSREVFKRLFSNFPFFFPPIRYILTGEEQSEQLQCRCHVLFRSFANSLVKVLKLLIYLLFSRLTLQDVQQCLLSELLLLAVILIIIDEVPPLQLDILQSILANSRRTLYSHSRRRLPQSLCYCKKPFSKTIAAGSIGLPLEDGDQAIQ